MQPVVIDGRALKRVREEQGITVRELSRRLGISESWIYGIQRGPSRGTWSTTTTVEDLGEVLGVEPRELVKRSEDG